MTAISKAELDELHTARLMARSSLHFYTRYLFQRRKGFRWKDNHHHRVICSALEDVYYGRTKRLLINTPPRYSKTEIAVLNFITWTLGRHPDSEYIHTSYSSTLAENNSSNAQSIMLHPAYQELFPEARLAGGARAHWKTTAGGVMYATGSGGSVTGFGAGKLRESWGGAIVIDDPIKASEAGSENTRQSVIDWYQNTLSSRTNNPNTPIIVIMQRLHEDDLAGWLLGGGNGEEWTHLCIPVLNEQDEPLWPWKHDRETLRIMEQTSPYVFAGQYMQRPAPLGGGLLKDAWWKYHPWTVQGDEGHKRYKRIVQSYDTAFKKGEMNDNSACLTFGEHDTGWDVLDIWKGKLEFPDLRRHVLLHAQRWQPNAILIEDKASGQSLIQELRATTRLAVIPIRPTHDKVARLNAVTPLVEGGKVSLPLGHPEVQAFISECGQFPNGAHDDCVDALTQGLSWLNSGQDMQRIKLGGF
jgi:predicted phage terminase large subunit-like protein